MTLIVVCEFEDSQQQVVREDFADLGDAVGFALALADEMGNLPGDGHGPAQFVHVVENKRTELTVRVFRGGLTDRKAR